MSRHHRIADLRRRILAGTYAVDAERLAACMLRGAAQSVVVH